MNIGDGYLKFSYSIPATLGQRKAKYRKTCYTNKDIGRDFSITFGGRI